MHLRNRKHPQITAFVAAHIKYVSPRVFVLTDIYTVYIKKIALLLTAYAWTNMAMCFRKNYPHYQGLKMVSVGRCRGVCVCVCVCAGESQWFDLQECRL